MNRHSKIKSSRKLRSRRRSRRVIPKLKKGSLTRYGYSVHKSQKSRHRSLKKALNKYGYSSLVKKLNAVKLLSKNTSPSNSKIYGKDIKYLQSMKRNDGAGSEYKVYECLRTGDYTYNVFVLYSKLNKEEVLEWLNVKFPDDDNEYTDPWKIKHIYQLEEHKDVQELSYITCEG